MRVAAIIPAYDPSESLIAIVQELATMEFQSIIVVNDGSSASSEHIFRKLADIPKTAVLAHAVNLGKGAALKTGLNHAYCTGKCDGVVTIDADGQHLPVDALKIAHLIESNPGALILGVRTFSRDVPLRSRFGNIMTKHLFRMLVGQKISDTQSGLRGIPMTLVPKLLKMDSSGYEFELDMLLAAKFSNIPIKEQEIATVYIEGNKSSHFNPLVDSMKIYFVLFRFMLSSAITAVIDYTVFFAAYGFGASLPASQASARAVAVLFNYTAVKKAVFYSDQKHLKTFPKYISLVIVSGIVSYLLITLILKTTSANLLTAKVISELTIFLANFAVQRDFIFTRRKEKNATDWDRYYSRPYRTAAYSRSIVEKELQSLMKKFVPQGKKTKIAELGGANSCFFDGITKNIGYSEYHVIDNNRLGLARFAERAGSKSKVFTHCADILQMNSSKDFDLVFSVGLIEHFEEEETSKAIEAHFKALKPGGVAIISFPTPTILYRATRSISEMLGLWIFHDERPLTGDEVKRTACRHGSVLFEKIIWPIFLTQKIIVIRSSG